MNEREFDKIFALMEVSFPESERRTYEGQKELLNVPYYRLITETDNNNQIVAFLAAWEFPLFRFVEHIAVDPLTRGSGIGGKMMTSYRKESKNPILLEVEYPDSELAQRRIGFMSDWVFTSILLNMCSLLFRRGRMIYRLKS